MYSHTHRLNMHLTQSYTSCILPNLTKYGLKDEDHGPKSVTVIRLNIFIGMETVIWKKCEMSLMGSSRVKMCNSAGFSTLTLSHIAAVQLSNKAKHPLSLLQLSREFIWE